MYNPQDFIIENKVLVKYNGKEKTVVIPNGVEAIGECAFRGRKFMRKIEYIIVPGSVKELDMFVFEECANVRVHISR